MVSEPDELWTPQQLADFCQVPLQTVYRWNRDGTWPYVLSSWEGRQVQQERSLALACLETGRGTRLPLSPNDSWQSRKAQPINWRTPGDGPMALR